MASKQKPSKKSTVNIASGIANEASHKQLFDLYGEIEKIAKIGYWEWDTASDCLLTCSDGYASIYGMSIDEVMENLRTFKDDLKFVHPDDLDRYDQITSNIADDADIDIIYRIVLKDGTIKHVHEVGISISDDQGKRISTYGSLQDITDQVLATQEIKKAHESLETKVEQRTHELAEANKKLKIEITEHEKTELSLIESQHRLKDFADVGSDWLYELDEKFRYSYFSEGRDKIINRSSDPDIGKYPWEITRILPQEEAIWETLKEKLERHEPVINFEHAHISQSGNIYYGRTNATPYFDKNGKFAGYRGSVTDITNQKQARDRLDALIFAINLAEERIALYDKDDKIIFCNDSFKKLNKNVSETLIDGTPFGDFIRAITMKGVVPEAIGREEEWITERMELHRNPKGPIEVRRQEGIVLRIHEQKLPNGNTIVVSSDIGTEKRARVDVEYANRTKREFLANMSHELRTPLNGIIGFSEMMRNELLGPIGNKQYKSYINDIHESGIHLLQIISDILDISKIEANEVTVDDDIINVGSLIQSCFSIVNARANQTNITLQIDIPEYVPSFRADNRLIKQILINLINNAVKFSDPESTVTTSAFLNENNCIEFKVTDQGIGIAEKDLALITEPFHQVRGNSDLTHAGTGLGLAIVDAMVKLHDGQLKFESEPGVGTTVTVILPSERTINNLSS